MNEEDIDYDAVEVADALADDGLGDLEIEEKPLTDEERQQLARRLVELRTKKDETKIAADKAKAEFEDFQREFLERVSKSPIKGSFKVFLGDDLGTVQLVPRETKYARILNRDDAEAYLRERGLDKEFIKDDFRMGRLHELVRECIEQKKPIPPGLDFYTKEFFTVTFKD